MNKQQKETYKFRCLGENKDGKRCSNIFVSSRYSKTLTCSKHKHQDVDFQYSDLKRSEPFKDVAFLIAKKIKDPKTFNSFSKVSLSCAKACHALQKEKKNEYKVVKKFMGVPRFMLPDGSLFPI